jgi:regulation of enolase protein 1 (concanavalin A-like superfamily)
MSETIMLPQLPLSFRWDVPPDDWRVAADRGLTIGAGGRTDLFVDPQGTAMTLNAPRLLGAPAGDFLLSARVSVGFAATFDAGVLLLYGHDRLWAKLCFEYSPLHHPMVVSVVTRGTSDDANSFEVEGNQIWLRIARMGPACAFHAATDGQYWQLIRHFALGEAGDLAVGFLAQSPTGAGCTANFDDLRFVPERLRELRDGS